MCRAPRRSRRCPRRGEPRSANTRPSACHHFEYWGALRAFLRPYFLLSLTRGCTVEAGLLEDRAVLELDGRSALARWPRRSAPACPVTPPPRGFAMTSAVSVLLRGDELAHGSAAGAPCSGSRPPAVLPFSELPVQRRGRRPLRAADAGISRGETARRSPSSPTSAFYSSPSEPLLWIGLPRQPRPRPRGLDLGVVLRGGLGLPRCTRRSRAIFLISKACGCCASMRVARACVDLELVRDR